MQEKEPLETDTRESRHTHKHHKSSLCINELPKGRPLRLRHDSPLGMEYMFLETRALKHDIEFTNGNRITVGQQQRHDLVGVIIHPSPDFSQIHGERSRIQLPAVRMTHLDGAGLVVRLGLQEPHPKLQLTRDGDILVMRGRRTDKGAVMAADKGHLRVPPLAELVMTITGCENSGRKGQKLQKLFAWYERLELAASPETLRMHLQLTDVHRSAGHHF